MRGEEADLSLEAVDRTVNERLSLEKCCVVREEAGGEIIRAIDDDVVRISDFHRVVWGETHGVRLDCHQWVHLAQPSGGAI